MNTRAASRSQVEKRMEFLFPNENRFKIGEAKNGELKITFDCHGLKTANAKRSVHNIIAMIQYPFELDIIHGYNHGTSIEEMLYSQMLTQNPRIVEMHIDEKNLGLSHAIIA